MKIHYLWILFALLRCGPQKTAEKQTTQPPKEEGIFLHQLAKTMTTQALDTLKQQGYQYKKQDTFFIKDGTLNIKELQEKGNAVGSSGNLQKTTAYHYNTILNDKTHVYIWGDDLSGYTKEVRKEGDYLGTLYEYYPSGALKTVGAYYPNYFAKGTWYWYNEQGLINRLKEYDKDYAFTWEEVLKFMQEKQISKENIMYINRGMAEEKNPKTPYWAIAKITGRDSYNRPTTVTFYELDGNTGAIIEEELLDYTLEY
ncbi:hypothetical protein DPIF89300162_170015 [Tenacibaculum maritimum]|uniref:hypothetical protein n=1 Tax=Tenacibaculum maritimum TaxID=107401 RepID=UPI0012E56B36|nr:hypothetical protein [Tenacibaculum maritimum]CAA0172681.1 hypothetical protein DPIF89300162_170015 [Tenacibaculum maritimum]